MVKDEHVLLDPLLIEEQYGEGSVFLTTSVEKQTQKIASIRTSGHISEKMFAECMKVGMSACAKLKELLRECLISSVEPAVAIAIGGGSNSMNMNTSSVKADTQHQTEQTKQ